VTANSTAYGLIGHLQRRLDQVKSEVEVGSQLALVRSSLLPHLATCLHLPLNPLASFRTRVDLGLHRPWSKLLSPWGKLAVQLDWLLLRAADKGVDTESQLLPDPNPVSTQQ
jgi:hypothetical protein